MSNESSKCRTNLYGRHDTRNHDAIHIAILESRYDTYRDTSLMLRLIDYQAKIKEAQTKGRILTSYCVLKQYHS